MRPPLSGVIAAGLQGALLLARGRPEGMAGFETTPAGALRSFWAAALCLPAFLALKLLAWGIGGAPSQGVLKPLVAELISYVCAWVGFALASQPVAQAAGRMALWPRFIAAWNWGNVVQYLVLLAMTVPSLLGVPPMVAHGLGLAGFGYALWLEWFIARAALQVGGGVAFAFVVIDLAIGIFLGGFTARLTGG